MCKSRWGFSETEIEEKWQNALKDPNVPKSMDEEGWSTIAKYAWQKLSSDRTLSHRRKIQRTNNIEASDNQLKCVLGRRSD